LSKFHPKLKILRRNHIKFYPNSNPRDSLNFHSSSISNLKKFRWRNLFLPSELSKPYFISNFFSHGRSLLDRSILQRFEINWIHLKFESNSNTFDPVAPHCSRGHLSYPVLPYPNGHVSASCWAEALGWNAGPVLFPFYSFLDFVFHFYFPEVHINFKKSHRK
jgi:hypothetical protein